MADPRMRRSRLPDWFDRTGTKQVDLARHLEVSESYISQVIKLKAKLSVENMKKTADYFGCHMDDLVEWEYVPSKGKRQ